MYFQSFRILQFPDMAVFLLMHTQLFFFVRLADIGSLGRFISCRRGKTEVYLQKKVEPNHKKIKTQMHSLTRTEYFVYFVFWYSYRKVMTVMMMMMMMMMMMIMSDEDDDDDDDDGDDDDDDDDDDDEDDDDEDDDDDDDDEEEEEEEEDGDDEDDDDAEEDDNDNSNNHNSNNNISNIAYEMFFFSLRFVSLHRFRFPGIQLGENIFLN